MSNLTANQPLPAVHSRPFNGEEDFWRVRKLLIDTFPIIPPDFNWEMRRWDGERYHNADPKLSQEWSSRMRVWETGEGELVGLAHPDGPGTASLQLHPDFRHVEEEMLAWCEQNLAVEMGSTGQRRLEIQVYTYDIPRLRIVQKRGYIRLDDGMVSRFLRLGRRPLPPVEMASGYRLRTTRADDMDDCQRMADLLNASFGRTFHTAAEYANFTRMAPCFRHELNLVAEAPDGSFAAHAGVSYEPSIRFAVFEPVCTHPEHRQKKLASTLMIEGLHRLRALGACQVTVGTGMNMAPANALYDSVGFTEIYYQHTWQKTF